MFPRVDGSTRQRRVLTWPSLTMGSTGWVCCEISDWLLEERCSWGSWAPVPESGTGAPPYGCSGPTAVVLDASLKEGCSCFMVILGGVAGCEASLDAKVLLRRSTSLLVHCNMLYACWVRGGAHGALISTSIAVLVVL